MKISIINQAEYYHSLGINIVCLSSDRNFFNYKDNNLLKSPNHSWRYLSKEEQSLEALKSLDWNNATGLGIVLGYKNLCAIDIDGCLNFEFISRICQLLGLPINYEWIVQSGSKYGYHIIVQCNNIVWASARKVVNSRCRLANASEEKQPFANGDTNSYYPNYAKREFIKIEFKWSGNLVLPGSLHITGNEYSFHTRTPVNFPAAVDFEQLSDVAYKYGSLQAMQSEVDDTVFEIQSVARKDEDLNAYSMRKIQQIMLFCVKKFKISNVPVSQSERLPILIQVSWLVLDKNYNVLKTKISNYFSLKKITSEEKLKYEIDYSAAKKLAIDMRYAIHDFLFDLSHVKSIAVSDESSIDFIKNEIKILGLYDDNFYVNNNYECADCLFSSPKLKEIVLLRNIDDKQEKAVYSLYKELLLINGIYYK